MFSSDNYEIFKNRFFKEDLRTTASEFSFCEIKLMSRWKCGLIHWRIKILSNVSETS